VTRPLLRSLLFASTLPLLVLSGLVGCSSTPQPVDISYTPADSGMATKIAGAEAVAVHVSVDDERASKNTVGEMSKGLGMDLARISADNSVPQTLQSAIETELRDRGFAITSLGVPVTVTLTKFENQFRLGAWSSTDDAEIVMDVVVKDARGTIYTRLIDVHGRNKGVEFATAQNAQIALDRALQRAVADLFADNNFVAALETAGKGSPSALRAGPSEAAPLPSSSVQPETNQPPPATPQ
jgi:uncharacterized lipoprotein YajG